MAKRGHKKGALKGKGYLKMIQREAFWAKSDKGKLKKKYKRKKKK